jgi:hypothetical protein
MSGARLALSRIPPETRLSLQDDVSPKFETQVRIAIGTPTSVIYKILAELLAGHGIE